MKFKIGDRVLVRKEVASESIQILSMIDRGQPLIGKITGVYLKEDVLCTICSIKHKPTFLVLMEDDYDDDDILLTPCEISPLLKEKIDKIINL